MMAAEPIEPARFPRIRTNVVLSVAVRNWLRQRARENAEMDGGKPSMSAILERLVREAARKPE
jgi:hypothetical protein